MKILMKRRSCEGSEKTVVKTVVKGWEKSSEKILRLMNDIINKLNEALTD